VNGVRIVSGRDEKGPACILVEAAGRRLLLDLGYGPGPVDAVLLSHGHRGTGGVHQTGGSPTSRARDSDPVWYSFSRIERFAPNSPISLHAPCLHHRRIQSIRSPE
jgi:hypothetical protein